MLRVVISKYNRGGGRDIVEDFITSNWFSFRDVMDQPQNLESFYFIKIQCPKKWTIIFILNFSFPEIHHISSTSDDFFPTYLRYMRKFNLGLSSFLLKYNNSTFVRLRWTEKAHVHRTFYFAFKCIAILYLFFFYPSLKVKASKKWTSPSRSVPSTRFPSGQVRSLYTIDIIFVWIRTYTNTLV